MRSLVTGATGLLGNNLVRLLLARGDQVRVLVRETSAMKPLDGLDVEVVRGGLLDHGSLTAAVRQADRVFNSAGLVHIGNRRLEELRLVNATGAGHVARVCREAGVRMVHVSSVDALGYGTRVDPADEYGSGQPVGAYGSSKRTGDYLVTHEIDSGLDAVIVHPAFLLGPWDWKPSSGRLLLEIARGRGLIAPPGGNDFCHVEDVAIGVLAAADKGKKGEHFILGGEALSYREAFDLIARVSGAAQPLLTAPPLLVMGAGYVGDLMGLVRGRELQLNAGVAEVSCLPHHFTDKKARERLGYTNRGAEAAVRDAWQWFVEYGYAKGRFSA